MWVCALLIGAICPAAAPGDRDVTQLVVPIDWKRLEHPAPPTDDARACTHMLLNSIRYNLGWIAKTHEEAPSGDRYVLTNMKEPGIRPPSSVAYAVATALAAGVYDGQIAGLPGTEALNRIRKTIKGIAATHKVNGDATKGWGDAWQSALWAALMGQAGWLLWDELEPQTRRMVCAVVEFEADRFIRPGYQVPYWNGRGGDTKAEENAWNAQIIQLAVAMMPKHPHVSQWKQIGSELMISAFAMKTDAESNEANVDGKPVRQWLKGYNVRDDGAVINHNLIHADYMTCFTSNLHAFVTQSLAGQPVPQSADFNAERVYRCLVMHEWPSPPHEPPGGTMYTPGKAEVYYPMGTDWSRFRFPVFYRADVYAHVLGWGRDWPHPPAEWMRLRADRILQMQARHADGHLFAPGEFDTYRGAEQMACWLFADAFLLHRLHECSQIGKQADWNND